MVSTKSNISCPSCFRYFLRLYGDISGLLIKISGEWLDSRKTSGFWVVLRGIYGCASSKVVIFGYVRKWSSIGLCTEERCSVKIEKRVVSTPKGTPFNETGLVGRATLS